MNTEIGIHIKARGIEKSFRMGAAKVAILKGVNLDIAKGEWVALLGASGSGKTTLLDIMGSLSRPDAGTLSVCDVETKSLSSSQSVVFRRRKVGFVFQAYHMLPELSVLENVMLPGVLDARPWMACRKRAEDLLASVGLSHRLKHRTNELSGGEQQRAAIARALLNKPELLLADEPTGNLDSVTGSGILEIFKSLHSDGSKTTIVMVTHDKSVAALADRIIELKDGVIAAAETS